MSKSLNIEEIKDKIIDKLKLSGWDRILRSFIYSKEFEDIVFILLKQTQDGKRFTPTMKNWFRAFEECPYSELKMVIVGQDPYPGINQADGIVRLLLTNTPSLKSWENLWKNIEFSISPPSSHVALAYALKYGLFANFSLCLA